MIPTLQECGSQLQQRECSVEMFMCTGLVFGLSIRQPVSTRAGSGSTSQHLTTSCLSLNRLRRHLTNLSLQRARPVWSRCGAMASIFCRFALLSVLTVPSTSATAIPEGPAESLRVDVDRVLATYWRGREGYRISAKEERRLDRGALKGTKPSTYGELTAAGVRLLAERWGLDDAEGVPGIFADLGCGVGKMVVQVYLECPGVGYALGVELSATRCRRAREAWEALLLSDEAFELRQRLLKASGCEEEASPEDEVEFVQGDLLDADISDVTHVYLSSLCFDEATLFASAKKLQQEGRQLRGVVSRQVPVSRKISEFGRPRGVRC
eukprot:s1949_g6.t1